MRSVLLFLWLEKYLRIVKLIFFFFFFDAGKLIEIDDRGDTFDGREL